MRAAIRNVGAGLGLAAGATGCASATEDPKATRAEAWRQVYAVPGTSEAQRELLVWDFTDPGRPVVHVFSFQENTFRSWQEIVLPTKPGTIWATDQDEDADTDSPPSK